MVGVKKDDQKIVEAILPENFPEKELVNKKAKFKCKITILKNPEPVKIDDEFAKNFGAKDLKDLKSLISKQINDEYKNSLERFSKNQILKEIEKFKITEIPENLIDEEVKILSQGMSEEDAKKFGWSKRPIQILLNNGVWLTITQDDEGNNGGAIHTNIKKLEIIPVI